MIKNIWYSISEYLKPFIDSEIEIGFNICYGNELYTNGPFYGSFTEVELPPDPFRIGTFHTHPDGPFEFSYTDIDFAIEHNERFMFLGIGKEVYGIDLRRFGKTIDKLETRWDVERFTRLINSRLDDFNY